MCYMESNSLGSLGKQYLTLLYLLFSIDWLIDSGSCYRLTTAWSIVQFRVPCWNNIVHQEYRIRCLGCTWANLHNIVSSIWRGPKRIQRPVNISMIPRMLIQLYASVTKRIWTAMYVISIVACRNWPRVSLFYHSSS